MVKSFEKASKEVHNNDNKEIEALASKYYAEYYAQILEQNRRNKPKEEAWWNMSNQVKQNGLYVGFENGKWIDPKKITKNEVSITAKKAMKILTHVLVYKNVDLEKFRLIKKGQ
jgi:AbiV family abortive infection protein